MACRENNWSLESATFYTEVTEYLNPDEIEERPKSGCYVSNIYLEGADWQNDNEKVKDMPREKKNKEEAAASGGGGCAKARVSGYLAQAKNGQIINPLPIIRIVPIEMHKLKLQVRIAGITLFECVDVVGPGTGILIKFNYIPSAEYFEIAGLHNTGQTY